MTGREAAPYDEYEAKGPYGHLGDEVGRAALVVLAGLSQRRLDARSGILGEDDFQIFNHLEQFETGIRLIDSHPDVDGEDIADLWRAFGRFHTALPLSEAERHWLFAPLDKSGGRGTMWDMHDPGSLVGVAEEITSGGLKQVIQGREVVRRLAAWRRETDEFVGQGTLGEAREALGQIATTLVLPKNWPREHEDLRDQLLGS